jgi:hypothetical protein
MIEAEQHRAAVHSTGERDADRGHRLLHREPAPKLGIQRLDVPAADDAGVRGKRRAGRIEEPLVNRIGIRTSDQTQRSHVVRGHHARVARMELVRPATARQLSPDLVDALGDDEHRSVGGLREEVPHRAVQASRQRHPLTLPRDERKGAVDVQHGVCARVEQPLSSVVLGTGPEPLRSGTDERDYASDGGWHAQ